MTADEHSSEFRVEKTRVDAVVTLNDALMELVTKKLVAPDEAYAKAVDKAAFEGLLKRAGLDQKPKAAGAAP